MPLKEQRRDYFAHRKSAERYATRREPLLNVLRAKINAPLTAKSVISEAELIFKRAPFEFEPSCTVPPKSSAEMAKFLAFKFAQKRGLSEREAGAAVKLIGLELEADREKASSAEKSKVIDGLSETSLRKMHFALLEESLNPNNSLEFECYTQLMKNADAKSFAIAHLIEFGNVVYKRNVLNVAKFVSGRLYTF